MEKQKRKVFSDKQIKKINVYFVPFACDMILNLIKQWHDRKEEDRDISLEEYLTALCEEQKSSLT